MSTLYIRLPGKAVADSESNWLTLPCPFAQVSQGGSIGQQGTATLAELSGSIATAQRVVLLLAASDVTLLRVKIPPLSAARLKAALPNLVEDQLIGDPTDCILVAGGVADGLRTIAVVQRAWLDTLAKTLIGFGAQRFAALPASVCLPLPSDLPGQSGHPGSVAAAIYEQHNGVELILRLAEQDGIGLAIKVEQHESIAHELIRTINALLPETPISLYVPPSSVQAYQDAVNQSSSQNGRISVVADNWSRWISGARGTTLDLMAGMGAGSGLMLDWRAWRWPFALLAALLFINAAALNIDWWNMQREATALRATMIQIYKSAYPKESVIMDPIAQMQQKITTARRDSGLAAPDDFTAITAAFGEAWTKVMSATGKTTVPTIAAIEYRERSLIVRLSPDGVALAQQMSTALAERKLSLDQLPKQSGMAVWQIRGTK